MNNIKAVSPHAVQPRVLGRCVKYLPDSRAKTSFGPLKAPRDYIVRATAVQSLTCQTWDTDFIQEEGRCTIMARPKVVDSPRVKGGRVPKDCGCWL